MKIMKYKILMLRARLTRDTRLKRHYKHMAKRALYKR